jgi:DNA-directed RNA polymerase specialized sigma24 family protein
MITSPTWLAQIDRERPRLVRLCARVSGDPDAAEDLAQETILAAHRAAAELREPERWREWLSGVARNVCRLDRALARLPAGTRAVLVARFVEQSAVGEIARRLDLSEGAVMMRLQRGKLTLRRVLAARRR